MVATLHLLILWLIKNIFIKGCHHLDFVLSAAEDMFLSVVVLQSPTHVWLFATPWIAACQISLSLTISGSLLKFMSITSVIPTNHLILCPLLLLLPSIFSNIRVFLSESAVHIRWPKDWSLSISPSSEYSGLIAFKIVWFDLPAVQGTLKSLLQHHSSKKHQCLLYGLPFTIIPD